MAAALSAEHEQGLCFIPERLNNLLLHIPERYRTEMWVYVAIFVTSFAVLMFFTMNTLSFFSILIFSGLISLLTLRLYGIGPLAGDYIEAIEI